ncbi:PTS sugar transporter subunit IIA [Klebsiella sp. NPDC088457]
MDEKLFAACQYTERSLDWRSAIRLACHPLAQQGKISADYAEAIISATEQNGPWYILSPEFALPHARPDEGVLSPHSVLSLVCCAEAVKFPGHPEVRLIIVLAAADSKQHIQTIQRLVCWLDEEDRLRQLTRVGHQNQLAALVAGGKE